MGSLTGNAHVHWTYGLTSRSKDKAIISLSVLLKDTSAATDQAGIRTHSSTEDEREDKDNSVYWALFGTWRLQKRQYI